ncbi:hypothetical protein BV22DRAFT_1128042 [Leucogyrophana mollusca]|uniref:Uncharacterized protein n=1 Tax=Leucogyrophana mollusca TaxID=85980 RepID=A0ACB8BLF8_9AGAM|nr:hypothetical protein BV22DRAFT_1128042 [Leucogyrophana mollusca]
MSLTLSSFPEELLARVLALCVEPTVSVSSRPAWHNPASSSSSAQPRTRLAPLLVSQQFLRIGSPAFYHTLYLRSASQTARALVTLRSQPDLAHAVRKVVATGVWAELAELFGACGRIEEIDICLDAGARTIMGSGANTAARGESRTVIPNNNTDEADAEAVCTALEQLDIKNFTLRKASSAYLTHPKPRYVLTRLAQAVPKWKNLESTDIALRLSADASSVAFAHSLSAAPRLRTVRSQIPAIWNDVLLIISHNSSLERVVLYADSPSGVLGSFDGEALIAASGMYMTEAKKHVRLTELIKAGTAHKSTIRTRAHTTISVMSTASSKASHSVGAQKDVAEHPRLGRSRAQEA